MTFNRPWKSHHFRILLAVAICGVALLVHAGCDVPQPTDRKAASAAPKPIYVDEKSEEGKKLAAARAKRAAAEAKAATDSAAASQPAAASDEGAAAEGKPTGDLVAAQPGVGQRTNAPAGFVTTPVNAYFSVRERLVFNQIVDGLNKFRAQHDRKPKDFAEVEQEIIKPRQLVLPALKPNDRYVYVPDEGPNGSLMVQRGG